MSKVFNIIEECGFTFMLKQSFVIDHIERSN